MRKTYITSMPNRIGAFLKASKCFSELGINITRVSYNKAVDSHILFIDAEGSAEKLAQADAKLTEIGYINQQSHGANIIVLEFLLKNNDIVFSLLADGSRLGGLLNFVGRNQSLALHNSVHKRFL